MAEKRTIRIGNLGAGVQSTTCYLLEMEGEIAPCEAWIFADVGEEPKAVYRHLEWLESLNGPRIIRGSRNGAKLVSRNVRSVRGEILTRKGTV